MACPTFLFHLEQESILIAIYSDTLNGLHMPGAFAFEPELLPGTAPVMHLVSFYRLLYGLLIHEGEHKNLVGLMILHNGRQQPLIIKFQIFGKTHDSLKCVAGDQPVLKDSNNVDFGQSYKLDLNWPMIWEGESG